MVILLPGSGGYIGLLQSKMLKYLRKLTGSQETAETGWINRNYTLQTDLGIVISLPGDSHSSA